MSYRRRARCRGVAAAVLALAAASGALPRAAVAGNPPTRLFVQTSSREAFVNEAVTVTISLRDAYNVPTPATKAYRVLLEVFAGKADPPLLTTTAVIETSRDSVALSVALPQPGMLLIKASHPELREASAFVAIKRRNARLADPDDKPSSPSHVLRVAQWFPLRSAQGHMAAPRTLLLPLLAQVLPRLDLVYSHEGTRLTANGADTDTITAFLSVPQQRDLKVYLGASGGHLKSNPIVIPKGEVMGETGLTAAQPGDIRVRVQSVQPPLVAVGSGGDVVAHFDVPIKELSLQFSPSQSPLGSATQVQVCLLDIHNLPAPLDGDKEIQISYARAGILQPTVVTLMRGKPCATAQFLPQVSGPNRFTAMTFGATTREAVVLTVVWPAMTIAGLVLGGILGGFARGTLTLKDKGKGQWPKALTESAVGPIVAVVAFLGSFFGYVPKVGYSVVTHPFGALLIGTVAGYLGASLIGVIGGGMFGITPPQSGQAPPAPSSTAKLP